MSKQVIAMPRLKGHTGRRKDNTWTWQLELDFSDGKNLYRDYPEDMPGFISREAAVKDMNVVIEETIAIMEKSVGQKATVIDMKNGTVQERK